MGSLPPLLHTGPQLSAASSLCPLFPATNQPMKLSCQGGRLTEEGPDLSPTGQGLCTQPGGRCQASRWAGVPARFAVMDSVAQGGHLVRPV